MKRYIDADRLKAEIEKRKHICEGVFERDSDTYYQGKAVAYQETLSLIDSLQQDQPSEDLEEEIQRYIEEYGYERGNDKLLIAIVARHFAEWQKEQMPMPEDTVIFQKGIEEGKRLMLEEAVEGYVNYYEDSGGILMAEAQVGCPYHNGDKVKIIIVKEDKE